MAKPKRSQRQTATRTGAAARPTGSRTRPAPAATGAAATNARPAPQSDARAAAQPSTRTNATAKRTATTATTATTSRTRSAPPPRHRTIRRPWWQGRAPIIATVVSVVLIVVLFIVISSRGSSPRIAQAVPADVLHGVTQVSPQVFSTVGTGGLNNPLQATPQGTAIVKGPAGKPLVLYIGAEYCPFCAAERWSLIVALSRFGTFSNLHLMTSGGAPEVYPNTNTFTFHGSSYTSENLEFQAPELYTNQPDGLSGYKSLDSLNAEQQQIFNKYSAPPYTQQAQSFPFLTIGNQFIGTGSGFSPAVLTGRSWSEVASALSDPKATTTQQIVGYANYLTAAICQTTNNQPANVCTAAPIPQIQQTLPKGK